FQRRWQTRSGYGKWHRPIHLVRRRLGGFGPATHLDAASATTVAVGDFNGDGKLDLVTANSVRQNYSILLGNGDGTFGATVYSAQFPGRLRDVKTGDFNGDSKLDRVLATDQGKTFVSFGDGAGNFGSPTMYLAPGASLAVGDFNGDHHPDIAVGSE